MTKILCTIWGLILNISGIFIFQANECQNCDDFGSQFKLFCVAAGVYVIVATVSLFPSSFRQPAAPILCLYELLATLFFIEFFLACIWSPIDVLILTVLPNKIYHILKESDQADAADWISKNEIPLIITYIITFGFFLITLHITRAIDYSIYSECGIKVFLDVAIWRLYQRISSEFPPSDPVVRFADEPYHEHRRKQSRTRNHSCCRGCR